MLLSTRHRCSCLVRHCRYDDESQVLMIGHSADATSVAQEGATLIRIGLIGYGVGGRLFHAPYIDASVECVLVGVVARSMGRISEARRDYPDVPIFPDLAALAASGVDAVVISTPPHTREALVREALGHGLHVLADKPFAPDAPTGQALDVLASELGLLLNVFHNRRYDTDIVTARSVLEDGVLGRIARLDLRCDQDGADTLEEGPDGGLLRDLGSHLVDQALYLLGSARSVSSHLEWRELAAGRTNVAFDILIEHGSGARTHLSSSKLSRLESRELRLHGTAGSYRSDFRDVQAEAIFAGRRPRGARASWGYETSDRYGVLSTADGERSVASRQGDYALLYDQFGVAVRSGSPGPVPAAEGVEVLRVLDGARLSDASGRVVDLGR